MQSNQKEAIIKYNGIGNKTQMWTSQDAEGWQDHPYHVHIVPWVF